ncbi:MAG TPA: hypothetical protein PKB01_03130 [Xanthobacteraceae bacterium]|nr:hypothetical protein [Xanthobacteraceae bacterium]
MKRAGVALAVLFWVSPAVADPLVLSCMPNKGYVNAYVWAFAPGGFPPSHLDSFRTLVRIGADEYELEAGHILQQSIREKTVRVHARQPLSAGETAELQIEGRFEERGKEFAAEIYFRAGPRDGRGTARCTLD